MNVKMECQSCDYCLKHEWRETHLCYLNPPVVLKEGQARPEVKLTDFCSHWKYCMPRLAQVIE